MNDIVGIVMATQQALPPIKAAGYEYVLAGNGLFVRAADSRMAAMVKVAPARLHGLEAAIPYFHLKLPKVPAGALPALMTHARGQLPDEAMYQFYWDDKFWRCRAPRSVAGASLIQFEDDGQAVVDLHSHGTIGAFFSSTDNADEAGLRFYAVVGALLTARPEIALRVGVYGHHWIIPAASVFEGLGPFCDIGDRLTEVRGG